MIKVLGKAIGCVLGQTDPRIRTTWSRLGVKMDEILVSREKMGKADDQGEYLRVPPDAPALQHGGYLEEVDLQIARDQDYASEDTRRLAVEGTVVMLQSLPENRHSRVDVRIPKG